MTKNVDTEEANLYEEILDEFGSGHEEGELDFGKCSYCDDLGVCGSCPRCKKDCDD